MTDRQSLRTSPGVARRELRRRLVRARTEARNDDGTLRFPNRASAAAELGWSKGKQDFLETGDQTILRKDLDRLFEVFLVPTDDQVEWRSLVETAASKGWWDRYDDADISPAGKLYISYEWGARRFRSFAGGLVPGLLQTADYNTSRMRAGLVRRSAEQMARMNAIRDQRKRILDEPDPLNCHLIFDESVLHRVADPGVMSGQIAHIVDAIDRHPSLTVQVVPFSAGAYPALAGSFIMMDFGYEGDPGIVNLEPGLIDSIYVDDTSQVYLYSQLFEQLAESDAASPSDSLDMLRDALRRQRASDGQGGKGGS